VGEDGTQTRGDVHRLEPNAIAAFSEFLGVKTRQAKIGQPLYQAKDSGCLPAAGRPREQEVLGRMFGHREASECQWGPASRSGRGGLLPPGWEHLRGGLLTFMFGRSGTPPTDQYREAGGKKTPLRSVSDPSHSSP